MNQIKFLCREIPDEEWSGILFYSVEGTISDFTNMKVKIEHIFPMNKGTATFTEYSFNEDVVEYRMNHPESLSWKIGHIHSHNKMRVFFSGTDMEELEDNSPLHNYYLSLIVNNFMDTKAKISFLGKSEGYKCINEKGEEYTLELEEPESTMFTYDCDITTPENAISIEDEFKDRVTHIIKQAQLKRASYDKAKPQSLSNKFDKINYFNDPFTDDIPAKDHSKPGYYKTAPTKTKRTIIDFTRFICRLGDVVLNDNLEAALTDIELSDMNRFTFITELVSSYPTLYENYWGQSTMEEFVENTYQVIEALEDYDEDYLFIADAVKGLKSMLTKMESFI